MADVASILANVQANTSTLNAVMAAIVALEAGHATVADEIAALQAQIAAFGVPVDFSALDSAVTAQTALVTSLAAAVPAAKPAA